MVVPLELKVLTELNILISHERLFEKGSFTKEGHAVVKLRTTTTPALEEAIVHKTEQYPETNTRIFVTNDHNRNLAQPCSLSFITVTSAVTKILKL